MSFRGWMNRLLNLRREAAQPANLAAIHANLPAPCLLVGTDRSGMFYDVLGNRAFAFQAGAAAVNWIRLTSEPAATPFVQAQGDGAAVALGLASKGAAEIFAYTNGVLRFTITAAGAITFTGAVTALSYATANTVIGSGTLTTAAAGPTVAAVVSPVAASSSNIRCKCTAKTTASGNGGSWDLVWSVSRNAGGNCVAHNGGVALNLMPGQATGGYDVQLVINGATVEVQYTQPAVNSTLEIELEVTTSVLA
jgi:hypothetical protein